MPEGEEPPAGPHAEAIAEVIECEERDRDDRRQQDRSTSKSEGRSGRRLFARGTQKEGVPSPT